MSIVQLNHLRQLLLQPEGPTLEFKQEIHAIDHPNGQASRRARDELAKDILSLANGNAASADESGYLIIGVSDRFDSNGYRSFVDLSGLIPDRQQLLDIVNRVCTPRLEDLACETVDIDGHRLFVIVVQPTPHLHETTRPLQTTNGYYTEHVVFIREGQSIKVASSREREAIQTMKHLHFTEQRNVPPRLFGGASGAIVGGTLVGSLAERYSVPGGAPTASIIGTLAGGVIGALLGNAYRDIRRFRHDLMSIPTPWRYLAIPMLVACIAGCQILLRRLLELVGLQSLNRNPPPVIETEC